MAYPILDWTRAGDYPAAADLALSEWAWEFLRRNRDYQDLWELFRTLPDEVTFPDGYNTTKNGKWRGTPWRGMRFFEDGAAFYADPPPERGEELEDYYRRVYIMKSRDPACFDPDWVLQESDIMPFGEVMPFAQYLCSRFKIEPIPPDPKGSLYRPGSAVVPWFTDMLTADRVPPWNVSLQSPWIGDLQELDPQVRRMKLKEFSDWHEELQRCARGDGERIAFVFDMTKNIDDQLERVRNFVLRERETMGIEVSKAPQTRVKQYPRYIRILDALAAGVSDLGAIAAVILPDEANDNAAGRPATAKIRANVKEAERLRDGGYFRIATG